MERDLGIKAEVIKKALSLSLEVHKSPEKPCLVERNIPNSPSQVIVAFPGSWSLNDWFSGDSKAKPFGETKIDTKKFGSLKSIGKEVDAMVNEAFMARFLRILDDGTGTLRAEVTKAVAKDKQIIFAGHSSGGPIATYATVWFLEEYIRSNEKQTSHPPLCLTFGSPLTTDRTFCHAVQREGWSDCFVHFVMKLDIIPRILLAPRSSATELRPCGKYVFCTETGKLVVMKNPDAVLQLLFYSLQIESETELQKIAAASLKTHWTYKDALDKILEKLPELPLSSDDTIDIGASLNDLNLCPTARLCLHAAGESEKQKVDNQNTFVRKKDAINKALKALDDYRTTSENDGVGYYDAFKMQKEEEDFKANIKRLELAAMWDEIIEMIRQEQLPDKFEAEKEWVELGTRFRRLVEPIDIANYYRHSKNEDAGPYMTKGRPKRYQYPQRWREHAQQLERDSSGESCFWAEVEELNIASTNKNSTWKDIENRVSTLEKNLRKWHDKREVEKDVFLEKSTLVKWWHTLPDNHKANSCIKELIPS